MKDSTRIILIVICIVLVIFLISVLTWGIIFRKDFYGGDLNMVKEEQYPVENIEKIVVSTPRADVRVFRTDDEDIKIIQKASRKVKEKDLFVATVDSDTLEIKDQRSGICIGFCFLPSIVYEIYIPNSYQNEISITTTSGDIKINALEEQYSNIKLVSVSGDIKLDGRILTDKLNLKTTSGDIQIGYVKSTSINMNSVSGDIEGGTIESNETTIKTTSGDIELDWISGEIEATSVSGDIELEYFNPIGNSNFKTTSGEIEVMLDKNASVKMHGDSVSGDIRFPHSESILGTGEHSITFKTTSGDVKVRVMQK